MQILGILPILFIAITHVYCDEKISLAESQFVTGILHKNLVDNESNDIKILCLGALVSNKVVVTTSGYRTGSVKNLIVGLFNWTIPGDLKSKLITSATITTKYRYIVRNTYDTGLEGLYAFVLSHSINTKIYKPINIPGADDNLRPEHFIRLYLNRQENDLVQDNPAKVDNEQCNGPINMNHYKPSIVSCFKNTEIITSSNATECVGQSGSPIIYGHRNATSNEINYYLYGLMYETKQCMFAYSQFSTEFHSWLSTVIYYFRYFA